MKKYWKALTNIAVALLFFLLILFLLPRLLVFFSPFVIGGIIALIAGPLVQFFETKFKIRRKAGSAVVIVLVIGLVILVLYLVGSKLIKEIIGLLEALPYLWEGLEQDFAEISKKLSVIYSRLPLDAQQGISGIGEEIGVYVGGLVGSIGTPTISAVGDFVKQLPSMIIGLIMALLSAYFFVAERDTAGVWFRRTMPKSVQEHYEIVKRSMRKAVGGYLKAQLRIEVWMYLLLVIGLSLLRVNYVLLLALVIAFLDLLPFFGTGTVLMPWALIKFLSADYQMALGLLIIWGVGQLARQIIQPRIVGDSIGMSPIPTLFLLYIGYKLGSVIGMIVAVPLGLIVYSLYQEGAFETTKNSVRILIGGINRFRRLDESDLDDGAGDTQEIAGEEPHA